MYYFPWYLLHVFHFHFHTLDSQKGHFCHTKEMFSGISQFVVIHLLCLHWPFCSIWIWLFICIAMISAIEYSLEECHPVRKFSIKMFAHCWSFYWGNWIYSNSTSRFHLDNHNMYWMLPSRPLVWKYFIFHFRHSSFGTFHFSKINKTLFIH